MLNISKLQDVGAAFSRDRLSDEKSINRGNKPLPQNFY